MKPRSRQERPVFIDYDKTLKDIETELARLGAALGMDWADETRVRSLAREVLAQWKSGAPAPRPHADRHLMLRYTLCGLVGLLAVTMQAAPASSDEARPASEALARAFSSLQG
nr:hypothetical protein [Rubrivivax gelatinosus]